MPEPTPGPWRSRFGRFDDGRGAATWELVDANGDRVIAVRDGAMEVANPADARLIACAPDLLAACREMLAAWHSGRDIDRIVNLNGALDLMEAAVALAEGRFQPMFEDC